jgi:hypothetical protein
MSATTDLSLLSEEAARRIKERNLWAGRQLEASEQRMAENRAKIEGEKRAKEEAMEKKKREAEMVADMLKEMYRLNPEFAARREAALQVRIIRAFSGILPYTLSLAQGSTREVKLTQSTSATSFQSLLNPTLLSGHGWMSFLIRSLYILLDLCSTAVLPTLFFAT